MLHEPPPRSPRRLPKPRLRAHRVRQPEPSLTPKRGSKIRQHFRIPAILAYGTAERPPNALYTHHRILRRVQRSAFESKPSVAHRPDYTTSSASPTTTSASTTPAPRLIESERLAIHSNQDPTASSRSWP
ncbi:CRISPR-associated endoribonuclease Cas2 (modular protein) [Frankia canadensis]|uniref:CRISPR-associated endoribonuclease Cas2 (Modular protein) n=1 Tax=Frankia canadensis TaxID=1836972 RepID=A0A2I2L2E0_9ACTN|nr:CRISPR-associated endoribonuclease Cas2 (modular protein) [Frankia canadensis]SOU59383.1 CRISPR-associated endoribonuclease Cas2 (modular protein) [Frankia canadensis]